MSRLACMLMKVDVIRDGIRVGTAQTRVANTAPALYQRLRGPYADLDASIARALPLPPPAAPAQVARENFADVVLSPPDSPRRHQLRVGLGHPVLFDHPVDHAPGMLLLEAARQAGHTAVQQPAAMLSMDVVFARYAELDTPCWIHTDPFPTDQPGRHRVLVTAVQNDVCVFSGIITLLSVPQDRPLPARCPPHGPHRPAGRAPPACTARTAGGAGGRRAGCGGPPARCRRTWRPRAASRRSWRPAGAPYGRGSSPTRWRR